MLGVVLVVLGRRMSGRPAPSGRQARNAGFAELGAPPPAARPILPARSLAGVGRHRIGARSAPVGERVKISQPVSVTPTVCSNWADSDRSRVTAVQPSDRIFTP